MTFSVVATSDDLVGGAVASHSVGVGSRVLWARPGIGVVATQASTRVEYGPELLDLLESGESVERALSRRLRLDAHADARQVAVMDAQGCFARHTGGLCVGAVSESQGVGVCAQGNMLQPADIAPAMVHGFRESAGDLASRLLAALRAGQEAGGDSRGTRSAALLVVDRARTVADLRVDDHPHPVTELERLLVESQLQQAIAASQLAFLGVGPEADDLVESLTAHASTSAEREADRWMWLGLVHAENGRRDAAVDAIRRAVALRESVTFALERFLEQGHFDEDVAHTVRKGLAHR